MKLRVCLACRNDNLTKQWCASCNGKGIESEAKPKKDYVTTNNKKPYRLLFKRKTSESNLSFFFKNGAWYKHGKYKTLKDAETAMNNLNSKPDNIFDFKIVKDGD